MKKLLSILLIVSTLFLSVGISVCSAENQPKSKNTNISQNVKENKEDESLKSLNDLKNQIKALETELKKQGQSKKQNSSIFSCLFSAISSLISHCLSYCFIYGTIKTFANWSNDVTPSVGIPLRFIPTSIIPFEDDDSLSHKDKEILGKFLNKAKDFSVDTFPNLVVSIDLSKVKCKKNLSNCHVYPSSPSKPLKDPLSKFIFFTVFDAPCNLLSCANSVHNSLLGNKQKVGEI